MSNKDGLHKHENIFPFNKPMAPLSNCYLDIVALGDNQLIDGGTTSCGLNNEM